MKFFETSKHHSFKKSTYITLRWIGIIGQLIAVNFVYFVLNFKFDFITSNLVIFIGIVSNFYLIFIYKKTQLSDRSALIFLVIDILQLAILLYLSGGIINPFVIFIIIPSVFSSSNLSFRTNTLLVLLTSFSIIFLTFYSTDLPSPLSDHFHVSPYYYYSIPIALIIALVFLNYFAMTFGTQSRLRKEALTKMEEVMAKEHELLSLGGQAAAAAHSLGTPLATISVVSKELRKEVGDNSKLTKDIDLLISQTKRCSEILKNISQKKIINDEFLSSMSFEDLLEEILKSFKENSEKNINLNTDRDTNKIDIKKNPELVYGLRNFIGNAVKFSYDNVLVSVISDNINLYILIEDDGPGFPDDIIKALGEPYIKSRSKLSKNNTGLGLGTFLGKTLLERQSAVISFENRSALNGAIVKIKWRINDLTTLI